MGDECELVIGFFLDCLIFLNRKPKWLVWIIIENIHKKIIKYKKRPCRPGARIS